MRGLPWWFWLAVAIVKFWYVTLPVAVMLAFGAWYGTSWLGGLRWILISAVLVLALPFPAAAIVFIYQKHDATRFWRTLDTAETIAGLPVPPGTRVLFADKTHSIPVSIELPHAIAIRGMVLAESLRPWEKWGDVGKVWGGNLAVDQRVDGFPCRAGPYANDKFGGIMFDDAGTVHRCTLASEYELFRLKLPPGTTVSRGNDRNPWRLLLPAGAGVEIPVLATTAPAGVTLDVANDGRLERIGSGHGQTIIVRGVPLNSKSFEVRDEVVVSELAEAITVAGKMRPAGTAVMIDLRTGEASMSGE